MYVPPATSSQPEQSIDKDAKIAELEAKVATLEAQVVGLQGQVDVLKTNDDFQLKTCKDNAQTLVTQQKIIDKQQKEILVTKRGQDGSEFISEFLKNVDIPEVDVELTQFDEADKQKSPDPILVPLVSENTYVSEDETPKFYKNTRMTKEHWIEMRKTWWKEKPITPPVPDLKAINHEACSKDFIGNMKWWYVDWNTGEAVIKDKDGNILARLYDSMNLINFSRKDLETLNRKEILYSRVNYEEHMKTEDIFRRCCQGGVYHGFRTLSTCRTASLEFRSAPRWNLRFDQKIKEFGYVKNEDEPCVYRKSSGSYITFLILYVDDILIGNNVPMLPDVKSWLRKCFAMKDLGEAAYILGIKIYRDRSKRLICLSQITYFDKVIRRFSMHDSKRGSMPMAPGTILNNKQCPQSDEEKKKMERVPYASAIGSIRYAMLCTRLDVSYA
ncbi:hypothetical protein L1987_01073 [Smallanthus sonchifolius]|uniref:Uncharacterized protein n=1 Tax=Smallanthus sonchifolius TaxID=185202 RepID=A0ACB9K429_9ASTR|nr:hypothetical protein L1987_01073 [Smallanthus sonchifolius]